MTVLAPSITAVIWFFIAYLSYESNSRPLLIWLALLNGVLQTFVVVTQVVLNRRVESESQR